MQRRTCLLILACITVWVGSAPGVPANMLRNAGFESIQDGQPRDWIIPEYWSGTLGSEQSVGAVHGGQRSGVLRAAGKGGRHWGRILQMPGTGSVAGQRFCYTMWVRGTGTFILGCLEYRSAEKFKPHYKYRWQENETPLTAGWQCVVYEFSVMDPEVRRLGLVAEVRGAGAVACLDDAVFTTFVQPGFSLMATPPHAMVPSGQQAEFQIWLTQQGTSVNEGPLTLLATGPADRNQVSEIVLAPGGTTVYRHDTRAAEDDGVHHLVFVHAESGAVARVSVDAVAPAVFTQFATSAAKVQLPLPARLLFIGDSLTDQQRGENYVDKLAFLLGRNLGADALSCRNAGVGGDYISRVWQRLQGDAKVYRATMYKDLFEPPPTHVFFFLGHNDSRLSSTSGYQDQCVDPATFEEQYRLAIQAVQQQTKAKVIVLSTTSSVFEICKANADRQEAAGEANCLFGKPEELARFNAIAKRVSDQLGCEFLDVYEPTRTHPAKPSLFNARDGVHLSAAGNRFIALLILQHLGRSSAQGR